MNRILVTCMLVLLCAGPLANAENNAEWRLLGNNADMQHYSPLAQINEKNVKDLRLAWSAEIPSRDGLAGNPLVANGVVYQSGPQGRVYANDVRTGAALWTFDPKTKFTRELSMAAYWSSRYNRGLALLDDKVFVASGDCHLYALDQKTGRLVWTVQACDPTQLYGITSAPRVGAGLVFVGNNCGDTGQTRGYVDAYEATSGKRRWRFYTVPGDPAKGFENDVMKKAAASWGTDWYSKSHGCGSVWEGMTYDAKLNQLYLGVASPAPWNPADRAKDAGDELFTGSIVALKADTGEYVWHYKVVPNDGWALHPSMHIMIADLKIGGGVRRVVMEAPKNSFFYVLDAKTGAFISAKEFLPQNWALGLDPKTGRPTQNPAAQYWNHPKEKTVVSPGPMGNHNWQAMAYSPHTGLVYIPALEAPTLMSPDPSPVGGTTFDLYYGLRGDPKWKTRGYLIGWDPVLQRARWKIEQPMAMNGGVLATGGNLVLQGRGDGPFNAYAADTGKMLWSFDTKESILAAPSTVEIAGTQYILIPIGNSASTSVGSQLARLASTPATRGPSRLLAFTLTGSATLPPFEVRRLPKPPLERQDKQLAKLGHQKFEENFCVDCHGRDAVSGGGSIKDLRFATLETHQQFPGIVIGGARSAFGMPAFPNLSIDDAKAIQAYIINQAWDDYLSENGAVPAPRSMPR